MRIAVVGGTGLVGREVVTDAAGRGHDVVALSRHRPSVALPAGARWAHADVVSGDGLGPALDGVDVVVDCANVATMARKAAVQFFETTTKRVTEAEAARGVHHHVVLSIVGIDDVPTGYYAGKLAQEAAASSSGVPTTIVRATQFHEFTAQMLARTRIGPVAFVPRMAVQTVAAHEVAAYLVDVATGAPQGRAADIGGPEKGEMVALTRRLARRVGDRVRVVPVRLPGAAGRAVVNGALLPRGGVRGDVTFDEWLAGSPS